MKVIEPGKLIASLIRCPHCEAILEIDKRDVMPIELYISKLTYSVTCPVCYNVIILKNTDNGKFKLFTEE